MPRLTRGVTSAHRFRKMDDNDVLDRYFGALNHDKSLDSRTSNALVVSDAKAGLGVEKLTKNDGKGKGKGEKRTGDGRRIGKVVDEGDDEDFGVELEKGRTSVLGAKRQAEAVLAASESMGAEGNNKKKRKKKKKSQQEDDGQVLQNVPASVPVSVSGQRQKQVQGDGKQQVNKNAVAAEEDATLRKRKKRRSKQKNIMKDKRVVKPAHLQIGSDTYAGRDLSEATRQKLGLPDPNDVSWTIDTAPTGY